jgi:hypothetical protein
MFMTLHDVTSQQIITVTIFQLFVCVFGEFVVAVNYTNAVHGKVSPSCRVATLVSGTGSRMC